MIFHSFLYVSQRLHGFFHHSARILPRQRRAPMMFKATASGIQLTARQITKAIQAKRGSSSQKRSSSDGKNLCGTNF